MLMIAAAAAALHFRQRGARAIEHAAEVRVDDLAPVLERHLGDVRESADAGVVHQHVEAPKRLTVSSMRRSASPASPTSRADGDGRGCRAPSCCRAWLARRRSRALIDDLHAALEERARDRQPDSLRSSGHDGHLELMMITG